MRKANFTYLTWRLVPEKIHFLFLLAHYGVDLEDNYIGMPIESNNENIFDMFDSTLDRYNYSKTMIDKLQDGKQKLLNQRLLPFHSLKKWDDEWAKKQELELENTAELASYKYSAPDYGYMKACMNSHYIIVWDSIHYIEDKTALIFTEKTWIPIFCGKPILFMYKPGALQKFKSHGYKSWPMIFDESYDKIESTEDRLNMIAKQVYDLDINANSAYFHKAGVTCEWNKLWSWKRNAKSAIY